MGKLFLDLSKMSKVKDKDGMTVFKHKDGHEIHVKHSAITEDNKKQMDALPLNKGGVIKQSNPKLEESRKIPPRSNFAEKFKSKFAQGGTTDPFAPAQDPKQQGSDMEQLQKNSPPAQQMKPALDYEAAPSSSIDPRMAQGGFTPSLYAEGEEVEDPIDATHYANGDSKPSNDPDDYLKQRPIPNIAPAKKPPGATVSGAGINYPGSPAAVAQADGGPVKQPDQPPSNPIGYPTGASWAKGGAIQDPTQRHLLPGDKIPNKIEHDYVAKFRKKYAEAGPVTNDAPEAVEQPAAVQVAQATPQVPKSNTAAAIGDPGDDSDAQTSDQDAEANYQAAQSDQGPVIPEVGAKGTAPVDESLSQKRSIYNKLVMGAPMGSSAKGGDPNASSDAQFGPNGEPPGNFNAKAWQAASAQFTQQQSQNTQQSAQRAIDIQKENDARADAGLPALPVPTTQPQAGASPSPTQAPAGDQAAQPQQQPQGDPYGINTAAQAYTQGLQQQAQGEQGIGQAESAKMQQSAGVESDSAVAMTHLMNDYQNNTSKLMEDYNHTVNEMNNGTIDSKHFLTEMSTGKKIATGIGLILGGMGAGLTHGRNQALDYLNSQIDRDIDSQKANLGKQQSLLAANMHQYGNLRDATEATKAQIQGWTASRLAEAADRSGDPKAQAISQQHIGIIGKEASDRLGNMAMRQTLLNSPHASNIDPATKINLVMPPGTPQNEPAMKQLKDAQDAVQLRDNTLNAFDQVAKLQTLAGKVGSPIQNPSQIKGIQDSMLDKLTKDTSGRVTPQSVSLIGGGMPLLRDDAKTVALKRQAVERLVSQGMNYPLLQSQPLNIDVRTMGRYPSVQSGPPIKEAPPTRRQ